MATYTLTDPIPALTNRGTVSEGVSSLSFKTMWQETGGGDKHLFAGFGQSPYYGHHVNMTTDAHALITGTGARGTTWVHGFAYNPNTNKLYIASNYDSSLAEFNPATNAFTVITDDISQVSSDLIIGDDGLVYYSDFYLSTTTLYSYNPSLGYPTGWRSYGSIPNSVGSYCWLAVYSGYVYVIIYKVDGSYELKCSPTTGDVSWTVIATSPNQFFFFFEQTTNYLYVRYYNGVNTVYYYLDEGAWTYGGIGGGDPQPLSGPPYNCVTPTGDDNNSWFVDNYDIEVKFEQLVPIKDIQEYSRVGYNESSLGWNYSQVDYTGGWIPVSVKCVIPESGTTLFCLGETYNAALNLDYTQSYPTSTTYKGNQFGSPYTIKKHPTSGEYYYGCYPDRVLRYNPNVPSWNIGTTDTVDTGGTAGEDGRSNPYCIGLGAVTVHYRAWIEFDANGLVWIAGKTGGSDTGGDVCWYDPADGTTGYMFPSWHSSGRDVRYMCSANSGALMCVSDDAGNIWIIDTETPSVGGTPIIPGSSSAKIYMIEIANNLVFGIVEDSVNGNKKITFNPSTLEIITSEDLLSGTPFGFPDDVGNRLSRKLEIGPDGLIWMFMDNTLYRIDPSTRAFASVATPTGGYGKITFASNNLDLMIYLGGPTDFRYYPRILTGYSFEYSKGAYSSLPADDTDLSEIYTPIQREDVRDDDGTRVGESGNGYILHQFKEVAGPYDTKVDLHCNLQAPLAPADYPVYLQCYDRVTIGGMWVTVATNNAAAANTDFDMDFTLDSGTTPTFANCKDESGVISSRVYQTNVPLS